LDSVSPTEVALDLGIADTAEIFVSPLLDAPEVDHVDDVGHPVVDGVATGASPEAVQATDTPDVELSPGDRRRRRRRRRRLVREQLLILLVLVVALAVTVALLASQWLLNGSVSP